MSVTEMDPQEVVHEHQIQVFDERLPKDRLVLAGIDASLSPAGDDDPRRIPLFTVGELGKVFFAKSAHWVRWLEATHKMVLDGQPIGDRRTPKGARVYTLNDVEAVAHALCQQEVISAAQAYNALRMVQILAQQWLYLE